MKLPASTTLENTAASFKSIILGFLPQPPHAADAGAFLGALAATGYMFPLIKATELVAGVMLLANRFVPLALTLLAPVLVNIVAFHVFLDVNGTAVGAALLAAELGLAWTYRHAFAGMLRAKVEAQAPDLPGRGNESPVQMAA